MGQILKESKTFRKVFKTMTGMPCLNQHELQQKLVIFNLAWCVLYSSYDKFIFWRIFVYFSKCKYSDAGK